MTDCFNAVFTALWRTPNYLTKVCDIPAGSVLLSEGETAGLFTSVTFRTEKDYKGWVLTSLLDEIINPLPIDVVQLPEQTYSLQDLKQFVKLHGNIQFNLCGEICVSMIVDPVLQSLLDKVEVKEPSVLQRVLPKWLSVPTGLVDLVPMLRLYSSVKELLYLQVALFDKSLGRAIMTPARVAKWANTNWKIIVGVKINHKGRLKDTGTPHWVVVTRIEPAGVMGGTVLIFNPASNSIEQYSWDEFFNSVGTPLGLLVKLA